MDGQHAYRLGHPLAEAVLEHAKKRSLRIAHLRFDYSSHPTKVGAVQALVGQSGWMRLARLAVQSLEDEDRLLFAAFVEGAGHLHSDIGPKLFEVGGEVAGWANPTPEEVRLLDSRLDELRSPGIERN